MAFPQLAFQTSNSYEEALSRAAAESGIDREYYDIFGNRHETSAETLQKTLGALGWDLTSEVTIDARRSISFADTYTAVLPKTSVVCEGEKFIPLTVPAGAAVTFDFSLVLEHGENVNGSVDSAGLPVLREVNLNGKCFTSYEFPLPAHCPLGYHLLTVRFSGQPDATGHLVVCPEQAYLPERLANGGKTAGFNVALYGLRSQRNWGCGDFTDLQALIDWAQREVNFSFIGVNPLHALHNRVPYNTSPYLPLSLYYKNLIYLDIERIAEFSSSAAVKSLFRSENVQRRIEALRQTPLVVYGEVDRLKKRFLKLLYREFCKIRKVSFSDRARLFESYCQREGDLLDKFALYCALDEVLHKKDRNRWTWLDWPAEYHTPDSTATREFAAQYSRTVEFYKYVQFVIEEQLAQTQQYAKNAGMEIGLYHDLAVATDSCGSDLWAHGKFYVNGCRVGAPPDDFSPKGQDWGFPPPNVRAHYCDGYRLYRESIRKILAFGGALRIDHVMRLFRLFWIPARMEAAQGAYVRDNSIDLMRILALESVRSKNVIIGEDLGTVTDEIRDMLARFRILSYRVFYFEKRPDGTFKHSSQYPANALVSSATHDLPTLAGFWLARDVEARRAAGLADEAGYYNQLEDRRREKQHMLDALHYEQLLPQDSERDAAKIPELNGELHNAVIGFLMNVPSCILLINQEDFTKETEQQNLPGSTAQYPNWQRKMQWSIEDFQSPTANAYAQMFRYQLTRSGRR